MSFVVNGTLKEGTEFHLSTLGPPAILHSRFLVFFGHFPQSSRYLSPKDPCDIEIVCTARVYLWFVQLHCTVLYSRVSFFSRQHSITCFILHHTNKRTLNQPKTAILAIKYCTVKMYNNVLYGCFPRTSSRSEPTCIEQLIDEPKTQGIVITVSDSVRIMENLHHRKQNLEKQNDYYIFYSKHLCVKAVLNHKNCVSKKKKKEVRGGTRTRNPRFRRPMPCPLGHADTKWYNRGVKEST